MSSKQTVRNAYSAIQAKLEETCSSHDEVIQALSLALVNTVRSMNNASQDNSPSICVDFGNDIGAVQVEIPQESKFSLAQLTSASNSSAYLN